MGSLVDGGASVVAVATGAGSTGLVSVGAGVSVLVAEPLVPSAVATDFFFLWKKLFTLAINSSEVPAIVL